MSKLAKNVRFMHNHELIGLAKNRFLDTETQVKIAEHPYRRAKSYLTANSGLAKEARDILWDHKGYVFKCELIQHGHFSGSSKHYLQLYKDHASTIRGRSPWRLVRTFIGGHGWGPDGWGTLPGPLSTPPEILEDIYDKDCLRAMDSDQMWNYRSLMRSMLQNPNLPDEIIIKTSASSKCEDIRAHALKRLGDLK